VIRFSLEADLSSLFTWNTKEVFVYVTAEWPTAGKNNQTNKAVIWDSIITAPSSDHLANIGPATLKKLRKSAKGKPIDPSRCVVLLLYPYHLAALLTMTMGKYRGMLSLKNQKPKYQITHPSGKIAETSDVQLKVHYNVQPWVGLLTWNQEMDIGMWKKFKDGVSKKFELPAVKKKDEAKKTSS
jgi:signal peptidase complex subunit 3